MAGNSDAARRLPTAILASSDHTAIGALHVLRRAGLQVPDDISVLGFANLPGSELVDPPLTTMGYDRARMSQLTITALPSLVQGEPAPGKIVALPPPIAADTTGNDRAGRAAAGPHR